MVRVVMRATEHCRKGKRISPVYIEEDGNVIVIDGYWCQALFELG